MAKKTAQHSANGLVKATKRINGYIEPDSLFIPADHGIEVADLEALEAITDPSDAELALYEKTGPQVETPSDPVDPVETPSDPVDPVETPSDPVIG